MARTPRQGQENELPPASFPETTPSRFSQHGHDFTLQTVIEMQRSLGELMAKVDCTAARL